LPRQRTVCSAAGVCTRDEASYIDALRRVEIEARAHRIWEQRGGDRFVNSYTAECQTAEERKAVTVTFGNNFPAAQRQRVEQAWDILTTVAAAAGTAQEIERVAAITRLPVDRLGYLATPMLERIAATPKTSLVVLADRGPRKDPGVLGSTTLSAEYDGTKVQDTGYVTGTEQFHALLAKVPKGERKQVEFTIELNILIPFYQHFYAEARVGLPYYLETLVHEIALHGETYVERITSWQESEAVQWKRTFEIDEHREHMFCGNPRYLLLLRRLYERGDQPPGLLGGVETELEDSKKQYTKEQIKPPAEAGDRAMLDWLELIKRDHQ
jgi:hypothetical protein